MAEEQITENSPLNESVKGVKDFASEQEDKYYKGAIALQKQLDDITEAYKRRTSAPPEKNLFDPMWLKIAAGLLAPTKTGGFGESVGYAATGASEEMERQKKLKKEQELQNIQDLESQFKILQAQQGLTKEGMQHEFISKYGEPNDVRQVAVTLPDGTPSVQEEKFFNPDKALKDAVKSGAIGYDKYLELLSKEKTGKMLTDAEAKSLGLDTSGGRKWNKTNTGTIEEVSGTKPADTIDVVKAQTRIDELVKDNAGGKHDKEIRDLRNYITKTTTWEPKQETPVDEESVQSTVEMIGTGQMQMPSTARSTPFWQAVLKGLKQQYPNFHAVDYNTLKQTDAAFTKGKQGDTVRSLNVTINHADLLRDLVKNLDNTRIPLWNSLANEFQKQTGQSAPTNFVAMKSVIADELTKGLLGGAGSLTDRQTFAKSLNEANSPKQLNDAIDTYVKALGGQLAGLAKQYHAGTNKTDFSDRFLYDRTIQAIPEASSLIEESTRTKAPVVSKEDEDLINKHLNKGKAK